LEGILSFPTEGTIILDAGAVVLEEAVAAAANAAIAAL
jgi:hypothetical protein